MIVAPFNAYAAQAAWKKPSPLDDVQSVIEKSGLRTKQKNTRFGLRIGSIAFEIRSQSTQYHADQAAQFAQFIEERLQKKMSQKFTQELDVALERTFLEKNMETEEILQPPAYSHRAIESYGVHSDPHIPDSTSFHLVI